MRGRVKRFEELGVSEPIAVRESSEEGVEGREGIERELRVIRVGPNPRMVVCEYWELASRRVCSVNVRSNVKWMKGMKFRMREPVREGEYVKPWIYVGVGPRRRGRW